MIIVKLKTTTHKGVTKMLEDMIRVAIQDFNTVEEMYVYVEDMYGDRGVNALENILEEDN